MHKKQDGVIAILTAYRDPLVDTAYLDEPFLYDAIWCTNHKIFCKLTLIIFTHDESD
jgi:hypothetical protein